VAKPPSEDLAKYGNKLDMKHKMFVNWNPPKKKSISIFFIFIVTVIK
jgi:hypothetical protein